VASGPWELTPVQNTAVSGRFPGAVRVRGAFGTGRSVVAACRAVHLASTRPGLVALVVPTATQLDPMRRRLEAIAEPDLLGRIVLDVPSGLARTLLAQFGTDIALSSQTLDKVWSTALTAVGLTSGGREMTPAMARDELRVIRGGGLTEAAQYDELRPELPTGLRHRVWALHKKYLDELRSRNVPDEHDLVRMARAALRVGMPSQVVAAVVDDANDLTVDELAMIHETVGDGPDALMLLDDGLPGLLPVGTTLRGAGIDVGGRRLDLMHEFRLTGPAWTSLVRLLQTDTAPDIVGLGERPRLVGRLTGGEGPAYLRSPMAAVRRERLLAHVQELVAAGAAPGSIALLLIDDEPEPELVVALLRAGLPVRGLDLENPKALALGRARDSRGVEFDHVVVPDAWHRDVVPVGGIRWDQRQRRRLLALALTRARQTVWIAGV
jgi:hypothetical protein